jgi:phasin family protein
LVASVGDAQALASPAHPPAEKREQSPLFGILATRLLHCTKSTCKAGTNAYTEHHAAAQQWQHKPVELHSTHQQYGDIVMLTAEQLLANQKANIATMFDLGQKAFEGMEKVLELNMQVAKTTFDEASEHAKAILAVKDAQELLALQASLMQPSAEKAAAYSRHLYDIATSTSSEVSKMAEAQLAEAQKKFVSVVDNAVKNAPAGSENAVVLVKSAMAAANNAFDSVQKAAKQAADVAEANFQAITNTAVKASQAATTKSRKAA